MNASSHTLNEIITAYRAIIHNRYAFDTISSSYDVPSTFDSSKFDALRSYFLTHIYPPIEKRAQLNEAFESLEGHLANPKYLLNVLMDSIGILFQYGPHLPKILRTGLRAMQSFKKASDFEMQLAITADQIDRKPPYTQADIEYFMSQLSKQDVDRFVNDSLVLFETLHDRKLVARIIDIVNRIINKMRKRPHVYPSREVDALELGRDLIVEGNNIFDTLTTKEQHLLFNMVVQIERDALKRILQ